MRLGRGPGFIALNAAGQSSPRIDHVRDDRDLDPDRTMQTLAELGVKKAEGTAAGPLTARIRMRGPEVGGAKEGTPELYFTDRTASPSSSRTSGTAAAPAASAKCVSPPEVAADL